MNSIDFALLINELPDEMVHPSDEEEEHRKPFAIRYLLPIAACLIVGVICAVIAPNLRVQTPPTKPTTDTTIFVSDTTTQSAETTTVTGKHSGVSVSSSISAVTSANADDQTDTNSATESTADSSLSAQGTESNVTTQTDPSQSVICTATTTTTTTKRTSSTTTPTKRTSTTTTTTKRTSTTTTTTTTTQVTSAAIETSPYMLKKEMLPYRQSDNGDDAKENVASAEQIGNTWRIVLNEPCEDAGILYAAYKDGTVYLSFLGLSSESDDSAKTIVFYLTFPDELSNQITDFEMKRQDIDNRTTFNSLFWLYDTKNFIYTIR